MSRREVGIDLVVAEHFVAPQSESLIETAQKGICLLIWSERLTLGWASPFFSFPVVDFHPKELNWNQTWGWGGGPSGANGSSTLGFWALSILAGICPLLLAGAFITIVILECL